MKFFMVEWKGNSSIKKKTLDTNLQACFIHLFPKMTDIIVNEI